jgi:GNAT superfamily N-acetyltransferase
MRQAPSGAQTGGTAHHRGEQFVRVQTALDENLRFAGTAFRELGRETVYSRFFTYKEALSEAELARIAATNFLRNAMLIVTIEADRREIVIASGSYSVCEAPDDVLAAEVAFIVEEDYQGQGIAGTLLAHLARIAHGQGRNPVRSGRTGRKPRDARRIRSQRPAHEATAGGRRHTRSSGIASGPIVVVSRAARAGPDDAPG